MTIRPVNEHQTFMVGAGPEEYTLLLEHPKADVPVASIGLSSLFSSRFVMVVSTQLVLAEHKSRDNRQDMATQTNFH